MQNEQFQYNPGKKPQVAAGEVAIEASTAPQTSAAPASEKTQRTPKTVVTWQASEFIEHNKNFGWFASLTVGALILAAVMYFLTHNILAVIVIVLAGVAVGQFARTKPETNEYELSTHGLKINEKFYPLSSFRSFAPYQDGAINALNLISVKRFSPALTVYFAPDDYDKIVGLLQQILPQDTYKPDSIEKMMKKVRF